MTQEEIHDKGFSLYNKIKVGDKVLEDAILDLNSLKKYGNKYYYDKRNVLRALGERDREELRKISRFYYDSNGLYKRICKNFAYMYRYDWYVVPELYDKEYIEKDKNVDKMLAEFAKILDFLDSTYIREICGDMALAIIVDGAYYGYKVMTDDGMVLQDLPPKYCRSRYKIGGEPVVEFNMQFFDTEFPDPEKKLAILKLFPDEFKKGYLLYKAGKLPRDSIMATYGSWYALEPGSSVKFSLNDDDIPMFANAIPDIIDLATAKDIDRQRQLQKLQKLVIQKLPIDKNGDLIFDIDEAKDLHDNAVQMLSNAIGVDVLTTFAEIDDIDVSNENASTTNDELERNERAIYNSFGVSKNLFNSDGNIALTQSILNDESSMRNLILAFARFFNGVIRDLRKGNSKKYKFRFYMLETTQYNYQQLSKLYKEQTQIGFSKMLPQIALGHSQSSILNAAVFENEILDLSRVMIPPLMSSVMSSEQVLNVMDDKTAKSNSGKNQNITEEKSAGRPEKDATEKSDKTLANIESAG